MVSLVGLYPAATHVPTNRYRWKRYPNGELAQVPDLRVRCTACHKVVFDDEAGAARSAERATLRGTQMRAYMGHCGHWHTTRSPLKGSR